jgi:hypothetical protein
MLRARPRFFPTSAPRSLYPASPLAMNDIQIRGALKRTVLARSYRSPRTLVIEELGLHHGAARIDVAVVNGTLHGYEIKSDHDSLARLPEQIRLFSRVLDRITLVVGWQHVVAAMRVVPWWWGVSLVQVGPRGAIRFSTLRIPGPNPQPDLRAVAALLWRSEALEILEALGAAHGVRRKPLDAIYERLADTVTDHGDLRRRVCACLRNRIAWRSAGL